MKTAIIVFAHGSSVEPANEAIRRVAAEMARVGGFPLVETAFLELARPALAEAIESLAARGATRVIVIPFFLTMGMHLQEDLPVLVEQLAGTHPHLQIDVTAPLDGHPALTAILLDRAMEALNRSG